MIIAAMLAACQAEPGAAMPAAEGPCVPSGPEWRRLITDDDRRRLREWREAFVAALDQARAAGHGSEIDREGALLEPDAALIRPAAPAGTYRCRTIKLGTPDEREGLAFVGYPPFGCRITIHGDTIAFTKFTGSQRPIGRLFADNERRMIFIGTLQLGDETLSHPYGAVRERDMVALLERIGERRWRLVFPNPHFESRLDVIELVPGN